MPNIKKFPIRFKMDKVLNIQEFYDMMNRNRFRHPFKRSKLAFQKLDKNKVGGKIGEMGGIFPLNMKDGFVSLDELSFGTDLSKGQAVLGIRKRNSL